MEDLICLLATVRTLKEAYIHKEIKQKSFQCEIKAILHKFSSTKTSDTVVYGAIPRPVIMLNLYVELESTEILGKNFFC